MTGSAKTRNIKDFISRKKRLFQDKDIVLAMDDDVAGWRANAEIMTALEENDIFHYQIFLYPNGITDTN
ncbi:toprim domain-containing protein, partial [Bacillus thuringiensis]|uniref:toprim domain-containing protein n=1 Tax=Bacillus thuringiensis TaxID=1428 RepID=UPI001643066F